MDCRSLPCIFARRVGAISPGDALQSAPMKRLLWSVLVCLSAAALTTAMVAGQYTMTVNRDV